MSFYNFIHVFTTPSSFSYSAKWNKTTKRKPASKRTTNKDINDFYIFQCASVSVCVFIWAKNCFFHLNELIYDGPFYIDSN